MNLIKKMKDILFDEEELIEVKPTPKPVMQQQVVKEDIIRPVEPLKVEEAPPIVPAIKLEQTKEIKSPFMDFDEDEFVNSIPTIPSEPIRQQTRVVEEKNRGIQNPVYSDFERKITVEKTVDYGRYERTETIEIKEKKKFQPSRIISPVYGVLNEDYNPDEIKIREQENDALDIDKVRQKAYGELDKLEKTLDIPLQAFYEEKTEVNIKPVYESEEKIKTIDELLSVSADEEIVLTESLYESEVEHFTSKIVVEDIVKDIIKEEKPTQIENLIEEDNTLESDLFDLIDSMYESKEEEL